MAPLKLSVELVPLVAHTNKRAVSILRGEEGTLTAGAEFDAIADTPLGKRLMHKMGLWISFCPDTAGKFHRFKNIHEKYSDCFVFIDLAEQVRMYGFTCHPDQRENEKRFELVVLTSFAHKKENHTDTAELNKILIWKDNMATRRALREKYSLEKGSIRS